MLMASEKIDKNIGGRLALLTSIVILGFTGVYIFFLP